MSNSNHPYYQSRSQGEGMEYNDYSQDGDMNTGMGMNYNAAEFNPYGDGNGSGSGSGGQHLAQEQAQTQHYNNANNHGGGGGGGYGYDDTGNMSMDNYYPDEGNAMNNPNMNMNMNNHNVMSNDPMSMHMTMPLNHQVDDQMHNMPMQMQMPIQDQMPMQMQSGSYYPLTSCGYTYTPHLQKSPISTLAIDPLRDAIYIAGHTVPLSTHPHRKRSTSGTVGVGMGMGMGGSSNGSNNGGRDEGETSRTSMLATHSFTEGSLYSAICAHPQGRREILSQLDMALMSTSAGHGSVRGSKTVAAVIPAHAYRPPYTSPPDPLLHQFHYGTSMSMHHMGITEILPFANGVGNVSVGYHCSISPAAIRVHSQGGMQISSNPIGGMMCGTFHPHPHAHASSANMDDVIGMDEGTISSTATHVTVGGISTPTSNFNLHCIDLYSESLKAVASHTVRTHHNSTSSSSSSNNNDKSLAITTLATSHPTCNILAGCSDGSVRIFDGRWRGGNYMECAHVPSHAGGVVNIATRGNLIATTGYSSKGPGLDLSSSSNRNGSGIGSGNYAFPDEHVLIYDIRFLGRGGIAHPFIGGKGGPRFLSFIPGMGESDRLLVASGQMGGGLQILTPFDSLSSDTSTNGVGDADYFHPQLDTGEMMTAMSVVGRDMAVGTNYGNVHSYRMEGYQKVIAASESRARSRSGSMSANSSPVRTSTNTSINSSTSTSTSINTSTSTSINTSSPVRTTALNASLSIPRSVSSPKRPPVALGLEKEALPPPSYLEPPALSLEPHLLQGNGCNGVATSSISIMNAYTMNSDALLSSTFTYDPNSNSNSNNTNDDTSGGWNFNPYSFGPLTSDPMVPSSKRILSTELQNVVAQNHASSGGDFLCSIQTSELGMNLVNVNANTNTNATGMSIGGHGGGAKGGGGGGLYRHNHNRHAKEFQLMNMNKLVYGGEKLASIAYDTTDPRRKDNSMDRDNNYGGKSGSQGGRGRGRDGADRGRIPRRYTNRDRPANSIFTIFDFAKLNNTLFPGCDYPPSMQNSSVTSVLLLLYFIPEIRSAMINCQRRGVMMPLEQHGQGGKYRKQNKNGSEVNYLSVELGYLFHQMQSISMHAMSHPKPPGKEDPCRPLMGTFVPSNFLSAFATMAEASALALLDDSPAAVEIPRRPEAFYRFLIRHLDKEMNAFDNATCGSTRGKNHRGQKKRENASTNSSNSSSKTNLIDSLQGMNAVSMNHFPSGAGGPSVTSTRSYTVDLAYDAFVSRAAADSTNTNTTATPEFGELLQYSLCKDVRLRAWCDATKSYETVVQRKIVTSLPQILPLSCACAGIHGEERLPIWRKTNNAHSHWLPELIEVEIEEDGNIITRQADHDTNGVEVWNEFKGKGLPTSVSNALREAASADMARGNRCTRYRLDMVLTHLNEEVDGGGEGNEQCRHVVHSRIPKDYKRQILLGQLENIRRCAADRSPFNDRSKDLSLVRNVTLEDYERRAQYVEEQIDLLQNQEVDEEDEWILFNGANVSSTSVDDARAFHVSFKEPCILMYRQIINSEDNIDSSIDTSIEIPDNLWLDAPLRPDVPTYGEIVAFDAEFVQTQNEESILTATGSKVVIREGRNAVGRMSILDCRAGNVLIDDHVVPREPVVDYLTRFSGITPSDLDPKSSPHHLITAGNAYLKMRYLVDKGCKFVGHGLRQDFLTVNLFVPPSQIIDTVDIFRIENRRYVSLRFLVNYLLGRDMQQEIHDSVEDSRAAYELYLKAQELKENGTFDDILRQIYERGQQVDWKVAELKQFSR